MPICSCAQKCKTMPTCLAWPNNHTDWFRGSFSSFFLGPERNRVEAVQMQEEVWKLPEQSQRSAAGHSPLQLLRANLCNTKCLNDPCHPSSSPPTPPGLGLPARVIVHPAAPISPTFGSAGVASYSLMRVVTHVHSLTTPNPRNPPETPMQPKSRIWYAACIPVCVS